MEKRVGFRFLAVILSLIILMSSFSAAFPVYAQSYEKTNADPENRNVNSEAVSFQSPIEQAEKTLTDIKSKNNEVYSSTVRKNALTKKHISVFSSQTDPYEKTGVGDISWSFDSETSTLYIDGTGEMDDYSFNAVSENGIVVSPSDIPWYDYFLNIEKIVIGEGITYIGNSSFCDAINAKSVKLPSTLKKIGDNAFVNCYKIAEYNIPEGVISLGKTCLTGVDTKIVLPSTLEYAYGFIHEIIASNLQIINKSKSVSVSFSSLMSREFIDFEIAYSDFYIQNGMDCKLSDSDEFLSFYSRFISKYTNGVHDDYSFFYQTLSGLISHLSTPQSNGIVVYCSADSAQHEKAIEAGIPHKSLSCVTTGDTGNICATQEQIETLKNALNEFENSNEIDNYSVSGADTVNVSVVDNTSKGYVYNVLIALQPVLEAERSEYNWFSKIRSRIVELTDADGSSEVLLNALIPSSDDWKWDDSNQSESYAENKYGSVAAPETKLNELGNIRVSVTKKSEADNENNTEFTSAAYLVDSYRSLTHESGKANPWGQWKRIIEWYCYNSAFSLVFSDSNTETLIQNTDKNLCCYSTAGTLPTGLKWRICNDGETLQFFGTGDLTINDSSEIPANCFLSFINKIDLSGAESEKVDVSIFGLYTNVSEVELPESVSKIIAEQFGYSIPIIKVNAENQYFCESDGVLYNKDMSELILYPSYKTSEEYIMPDSVLSINTVFYPMNSHLKSITLGSGFSSFNKLFFNSFFLKSINVSNANKKFSSDGTALFYKNTLVFYPLCGPSEYFIPAQTKKIDEYAFTGTWLNQNFNLKKLVFPYTMTYIGDNALANCISLESVVLPNKLKQIGKNAFFFCQRLDSVNFPSLLADIGSYAFYGCSDLKLIYCPNSIVQIGENAFPASAEVIAIENKTCSVDKNSKYSKSVIYGHVDSTAETFAADNELKFVNIDEEHPIFSGTEANGIAWTIQNNTIIFSGVGEIDAFSNQRCTKNGVADTSKNAGWLNYEKYIRKITVNPGINKIGDMAFSNMSSLTDVELGDDVSEIGRSSFYACKKLSNINFNSVKIVNGGAFTSCDKLTSIVFTDSVEYVGVNALSNCTQISDVYFYNPKCTIESIGIGQRNSIIHGYKNSTAEEYAAGSFIKFEIIECLHENAVLKDTVLPTCTQDGKEIYYCSVCNNTYDIIIKHDPDSHLYSNEWTVDITPTCIKDGSESRHCMRENCSARIDNRTIKASGHDDSSDWIVEKEASCLNDGKKYQICTRCNEMINPVEIPALGHDYNSSRRIDSLTGEGFTVYTCSRCSDTYEVPDPAEKLAGFVAVGGIYKVELSWTKAAEASVTGYEIYRKSQADRDFDLLVKIDSRDTLAYIDSSVVAGNEYTYRITAVKGEIAGEFSDEVSAVPTKDTIPPVVTKLTPASGSLISGTVNVTVTASDNIGIESYALEVSDDDGNTWRKVGESESNIIVFDTSEYAEATVKVRASATDKDMNTSDLTPVYTYIIDNTPPGQVKGLRAKSVLSSVITLAWDKPEAKDTAYFILQRKVNGIFTQEAKIYTSLGYNLTQLSPDTDYTFRVTAVDNAGNIGEYSDELTVRTLKDTTAPVITAQSPEPGRYNDFINFKVTAEDDCAVKSVTFQVSDDAVTWTDLDTVYAPVLRAKWTVNFKINLENRSDGDIYVRAVAEDNSGNVGDTSSSAPYVQYYVDKTAPAEPENVSAVGSDGFIRISWSQGSEEDIGSYSVYRALSEDGEYSLIASNIKKLDYYDRTAKRGGVYYYKVTCSDTCGNTSGYSKSVYANALADTIKPVINSINPPTGTHVGEAYNKISVLASDNNLLDDVVIEYRVGPDGDYVLLKKEENIALQSTVISAYLDLSDVSDGEKIYVRAYCTDIAGLKSDMSGVMVYETDKTAPEVNQLSAVYDSGVNIVTWKDNNETDIAGFRIYRRISGRGYTAVGSRSANSSHSYTFSDAVGEGTYTYRVDAVDKTGNVKSFYSNSVTVPAPKTEIKAEIECRTYFEVNVQESVSAKILSENVNIVSYEWDFGDSTTSASPYVNKSYKQTGEYTITLKVTDENGNTAACSKIITVTDRKLLGTVRIKVADENKTAMPGVPVYFDLGEFRQQIVYTDANGYASFVMDVGAHNIGVYKNGYLPACTSVSVLSGVTTNAQLTLVKQDIVSGSFNVREMTFEEIAAAGLDVNDPANQQVYRATVTLRYGNSEVPISYIRNNERILSYTVSDSGGIINTPGTGGYNEIKNVAYIPNDSNAEVIAVIEAPVHVTYLKQFYSATLRIINNSSEDFTLTDCTAQLKIPDGLTLMQSSTIDSVIKGQSDSSATWILRGDEPGEYSLTAEFNSTLDKFNVPVSASFVSENAVKVRKMSDTISIVVETPDDLFMQLKNDDDVVIKVKDLAGNVDLGNYKATALFNVGFKNISDSEIYMPSISVDKITALMRKQTGLDETQTEVKEEAVFIINADSSRTKVEDLNSIKSLSPGCTLIKYYSVVFKEANELTKKQLFSTLSDITLYGVSDEEVKLETRVDDQLFSMYYYGKIFDKHIHSFKETEGSQGIIYACPCGYSYTASVSSEDAFDYDEEGQRILDSLNFDIRKLLSSVKFENDKIVGPELNILGFKFNIFELDTKFNLPILENSSVVVDPQTQTIKILIGTKETKKANIGKAEQSSAYWTESYKEVKSFYKAIEGENAPTRDLYNKFRKLRKGMKTNGIESVGLNFDADLAGYIEFSYKNGIEFREGGLITSFNMGASVTVRPLKIFYASIGIGGGLSGSLTVKQSNYEVTFSGSVTGSLNNSYTLGVGENSIIKIYAQAKAVFDLSTTFGFPAASFKDSMSMKLTGDLKAKAAFFGAETSEFTHRFLDFQIYPRKDESENKSRRKSLKSSKSFDFTPIERDYSLTTDITTNDFTFTKNDLYPYSTPSVVILPDGREAMFWIDDNAEKQAVNRTDVYYSIFENGTWSSARVAFESKGFCDGLKTAYDSNGVYLLFAETKECDDNADYSERINSSELYCSYFDGTSFSEPVRVTDNDRAEIGYSISASGSGAKIAYVTNSENDYFDAEGTDTVSYCEVNNGNVSDVFSYEFNGISSMDVSRSSAGVYVVSSENDNVIYALDSSGKTAVYEGENSVASLNAVDDGLFFTESAKSMFYNGTSVVFAGLSSINNLSAVTGSEGKYILITNVNESTCGTLYACEFNASNFDYGSVYPVFSQNDRFIREYDAVLNSDSELCICVNGVKFSDDGSEVSSDLTVINTNKFIDISVDDLYVDYSSFSDDGLIYADITNKCSSEIKTLNVSVSDENGGSICDMQIRTSIKPGETVTERIMVNAESIVGNNVYVTVTPEGTDGNMADNTRSADISVSDVLIKDVKITLRDDKAFISGSAENIGSRETENTVVSLKELNSSSPADDVQLGSIATDSEKAFSLEIPSEYFEAEDGNVFRMILSASVNSGEKNYSNNVYEFSYSSIHDVSDERVCINHNYILTSESESTCIKHGEKVFTCKNCGDVKNEVLPLGPHSESDWVTDVKATCLNTGSEHKFCTVCSEILETRTTEKTGHTPSDWIVAEEATCIHEGIRYKECVDCMTELESEIIPKLDHTDEDGDNICDVCGEQIPVTVSCSHICHKKGFAGFIWRIIRIIFKIFGSNKYCECGAEHY